MNKDNSLGECPNIYCPNQRENRCENYIGLPIACESRDKYIDDHCPDPDIFEMMGLPNTPTIDDLPF